MRPARKDVMRLMQHFNNTAKCRSHGSSSTTHRHRHMQSQTKADACDYAFDFKSSNLRFGRGVTSEVGADLANMGAKYVCLVTDANMVNLSPVKAALDSLHANGVKYDVYDQTRIEPTDTSLQQAIEFARSKPFDSYLAVGGGSVMDTAKVANLYSTYPDNDFYDFVNAPIGKGKHIPGSVKPFVAVPTTTGTGSESSGIAVFDIESMGAKAAISDSRLIPNLGLVDSKNAQYQPNGVVTASGFDVLCNALESYTALAYTDRSPRPENPKDRPGYQGANPIADIWCKVSLPIIEKYFVRAATDMEDFEAREQMMYASTFAGLGFGTAGVHLCHGMSYPISGISHHREYAYRDYEGLGHAIIPHGVSVVLSAPAVFEFTVDAKPERHRECALMLGIEEENMKDLDTDDIGKKLRDKLLHYMDVLQVPLGLTKCGFTFSDIDDLVKGALPQQRIIRLSPHPVDGDILGKLYEKAMAY